MKVHSITQKLITGLLYVIPLIIFIDFILTSSGLNADEPFTLSLIHHSYSQIINIDSFDVHPPFYYLILKLFLQITTFWTQSIIVKIIFARILSLIAFSITFYVLIQILNLCNIDINWKIQLALYLVFPAILQYSLIIRMYQLATMFLALEIYGLLLYKYKSHNKGLVLAGISFLLVLYTNYFAGAFAGAILLISFVKYCFNHNPHKAIHIIIAGIIDILLFSLYSPVVMHQIKYVSSSNYANAASKGIKNGTSGIWIQLLGSFTGKPVVSISSIIGCTIFLIIEIILTSHIIKKSNSRYRKLLIELLEAFILGFIPSIILSLISHPMIEWRYGFPIFAIIYFVIISDVTNCIDNYNITKLGLSMFIIILGFIMLYTFSVDKTNIHNVAETITAKQYINNDFKRISTNGKYNPNNTNYIVNDSVFSLNRNTKIQAKHVEISNILAKNNRPLFKKVFSNVHLEGKSE